MKAAIGGIVAGAVVAGLWLVVLPKGSKPPTVAASAPAARAVGLPDAASPSLNTVGASQPLPVVPDPSLTAMQAPQVVAQPRPQVQSQPPKAMPGFIAGPPPRNAEPGAATTERNRRFLDAVQNRTRP